MVPVQNELPQKKGTLQTCASFGESRSIDDDDDYDDRLKTFQNATKHATFVKGALLKRPLLFLTSVYHSHRLVRFIVI